MRAIPIISSHMGGSAFLLRDEGRTWLVTSAHVLTGVRHASPNWNSWDRQLRLMVDGGAVTIPTIDETNTPLFRWVPADTQPELVEDTIALGVEGEWTRQFSAFRRDKISRLHLAELVTGAGYPGIGAAYPAIPLERYAVGMVRSFGHNMFSTSSPYLPGFSGGPIYSGAQLFGCITGNIDNDTTGLAVSMADISQSLLGSR